MSLRKFSDANLSPRTWGGGAVKPWVRNPAWLALDTLTESDQKFIGLHAVYEDGSNFCALSAGGNFTVNWGDGSGNTNVNSGVTAERNIAWADAATTSDVGIADVVSCTFQDTGDTVTVTGHTFKNGDRVAFNSITSTTGISTYTTYFVRDVATNTFKVASTRNGTALTLTTDGTGSVYLTKYRQVIITVEPQAGQNLTMLNLHVRHSQANLNQYASGFLDIAIAGQHLTDLRLGAQTPGSSAQVIRFGLLEQLNIVRSDLRQLAHLFHNAFNLRSIAGLEMSTAAAATLSVTFQETADTVTCNNHGFRDGDSVIFTQITSTTGVTVYTNYYVINATQNTFQLAVTHGGTISVGLTTDGSGTAVRGISMLSTFNNCYQLKSIPLLDTAAVINMSFMFNGCYLLKSIPLLDTAAVTNMSNMFTNCYSLSSVPLLDTAAVTNMSNMFSGCYSLTSVPLFNTAAVTNMSSMLSGCINLESVPLFDTALVTSMSGMFNGCFSLKSVPLFDTAAVTGMSSMFAGCSSLPSVPLLDTSAVTNMSSMFSSDYSLKSVPLLNTAAVTSIDSMFNNCYSLTSIPALDCSGPTAMIANVFTGCSQLSSIHAFGFDQTFSVSSCKLSGPELDRLYTGLGTGTGKTITVSTNWGTSSDDPTIATAKGWTVTGT